MRFLALLLLLPSLAAAEPLLRNCGDATAEGKSSVNWANCLPSQMTWERPDRNLLTPMRLTENGSSVWTRGENIQPGQWVIVCNTVAIGNTSSCYQQTSKVLASSLNWGGQPEPDPVPPAPTTREVHLKWIPPTQNENGTSLTDLAGYWLEIENYGSWTRFYEIKSAGLTDVVVAVPSTASSLRLYAYRQGGIGGLASSPVVFDTRPNAPVIVGDQASALSLVSGSSTGLRAVYSKAVTGSRGPKLGDLNVGPDTITDYARMECDTGDVFVHSGIRYAKVIDERAGALRGFYVSGCAYTGLH
jgi:hypothetical protein